MRTLEQLRFVNRYATLPETFFRRVRPSPEGEPQRVSFNPAAAELLDLDPAEAGRDDFARCFAGWRLPPGAEPIAAVYAGHQFGVYVPQLGDGRAILLGEVENAAGGSWDVQLKGAGPTPYCRGFDGRAVLRSTIREYLCSEAMHGLGIPTTRALCIVGTNAPVHRETVEPGAVLTRLAQSHVRFGTFEYFSHSGRHDDLARLADFVIRHHYPALADQPPAQRYAGLFAEVVTRTAQLLAHWQAMGFAHGVMNTDNMSILGLTLDYGPYGFMDAFDIGFVPNHTDVQGRYAFDRQPHVA
ncbi:MAG: YdiU family protein, partial [Pseudomonadota bacterium]|nr:YdiU family protein [Pseudomonadota bacterium]